MWRTTTVACTEWWQGWILRRVEGRAAIGIRRGAKRTFVLINPRPSHFRPSVTAVLVIAVLVVLHRTGHLPPPRFDTMVAAWVLVRWAMAHALPMLSRVVVVDDRWLIVQDSVRLPFVRLLMVERAQVIAFEHDQRSVLLRLRDGRLVPLPMGGAPPAELARVLAEELSGGDGAELLRLGHAEELR